MDLERAALLSDELLARLVFEHAVRARLEAPGRGGRAVYPPGYLASAADAALWALPGNGDTRQVYATADVWRPFGPSLSSKSIHALMPPCCLRGPFKKELSLIQQGSVDNGKQSAKSKFEQPSR